MRSPAAWLLAALLVSAVNSESSEAGDTCDASEVGPWSALLEDWATSPDPVSSRHGRIMALPPTKGYYVTDRVDGPHHPPGPPPHGHGHPMGPPPGPYSFDEWHMMPPPPPPGKILNRPPYPKPNKDQFKPSPAYPAPQNQPPPGPNTVDRVDNPPPPPPAPAPSRKEVSETDLYLLGAIEKLVYRVDLMEKRLRKLEESVHYVVAGNTKAPVEEPCVGNFTRVGGVCYHVAAEALDWKSANLACRKHKGHLVEFRKDAQRRQLAAALQKDKNNKDTDWWTGGLNPGLLWIWASSGRPILANSTAPAPAQAAAPAPAAAPAIAGDGRCLAVLYQDSLRAHVYRGQDCAFKHRYICEMPEDKAKLSNEIERVAKMLKPLAELQRRQVWLLP